MTVHTCTMRVEKVCKVREEPAPCLITAQGATGCDGVWQCVAGRLSDKVLAPRSTVTSGQPASYKNGFLKRDDRDTTSGTHMVTTTHMTHNTL